MCTQTKYIFYLLLVVLIAACGKEDSAPTQPPDPPKQIEKSPKRGLAYNLTNSADLDTLKNGVLWW